MYAKSEQASSSRRALFAVELIVSVVLLAILFSRLQVYVLWTSARRASAVWLLVALGLCFLNVVASTWRWRLLLDAQNVRGSSKLLLSLYLVAGLFNTFLPSIIGGHLVRTQDTAQPAT